MTRPALSIILIVLCLTGFGLLMVGNASVVSASRDFGDQFYYLKLQAGWILLGFIGFLFFSKYPHRKLEKYASHIFVFTIVLLLLVLIPGIGLKLLGARRWINLGFTSFQPAEFAKLATAIYVSKLFKSKPAIVHLGIITGLLGFLLLLEPDMGTAIVITSMCLLVYFGAGGKIKPILGAAPLVGLVLLGLIVISPYRATRLKSFLDLSHDPLGSSYQVRQALIALGSGGIWGRGLGQSQQKYNYLPEVTTDSIFAVVGEELGLIGSSILVLAFLSLTIIGLQLSRQADNQFSSNLALAISGWLGFQAFINMSAIVSLLPFTGIPLTFVSYGGSALLMSLVASGILVNIARSHEN